MIFIYSPKYVSLLLKEHNDNHDDVPDSHEGHPQEESQSSPQLCHEVERFVDQRLSPRLHISGAEAEEQSLVIWFILTLAQDLG